jgi:hypothetical protein
MEVANMTPIEKDDLVELKRDVDENLSKGLVGMVLENHSDNVEVEFPLPGNSLHAQLPQEDVKFIANVKTPEH